MSDEGDTTERIEVPVDGTQLALVLASVFALACWPFERPDARAIATPSAREAGESLHDAVWEQTSQLLAAAGLLQAPTRIWTRDFVLRRAAIRGALMLTREQVRLTIVALHASHEEFSRSWGELCIVTPGNIDWYDAEPKDLLELASHLEGHIRGVTESCGP